MENILVHLISGQIKPGDFNNLSASSHDQIHHCHKYTHAHKTLHYTQSVPPEDIVHICVLLARFFMFVSTVSALLFMVTLTMLKHPFTF